MKQEEERARLFLLEASGKEELYDRILYKYDDREEMKVPDSAQKIKQLVPKISTGELDLRASTIPEAGNGVFVKRAFQKNEIITYYDGPVISGKDANLLPLKTHHKTIVTGGSFVVVGHLLKDGKLITDPRQELKDGGVGAFLNDARSEERNNVEFLIVDMKENQRIWVDRIKSARKLDPSNKVTVRILMPYFDQMIQTNPFVREKFKLFRRMIIVRALRDIEEGEELFVSYGNNYHYFGPEEADGKKRAPDDGELRVGGGEKRVKLSQKCLTCHTPTEYYDILTQNYLCSAECLSKHYENFPLLLSFFRSLCQEY